MFDYLDQLRATRRAYVAAGATIDQMRASLRDCLAANTAGPLREIDTTHDDLFAPAVSDAELEQLFGGKCPSPIQGE